MKSIIQEASSIARAVEEGWSKAGKPEHFSVKILEEAEKNFLGLTKKSAKVAIFFEENAPYSAEAKGKPTFENKSTQARSSQQRTSYQQQAPKNHQEPKAAQRQPAAKPQPATSHNQSMGTPAVKKQFEPLWTPAMVERAKQWMDEALKNSNNGHISFTVEPQKFHMRFTLSSVILDDPDKEKQLLASFSALILETLKRTFKMSLRGHKIVLTHKVR